MRSYLNGIITTVYHPILRGWQQRLCRIQVVGMSATQKKSLLVADMTYVNNPTVIVSYFSDYHNAYYVDYFPGNYNCG